MYKMYIELSQRKTIYCNFQWQLLKHFFFQVEIFFFLNRIFDIIIIDLLVFIICITIDLLTLTLI